MREEFGKEIMLILDVKTRWNSLLGMLERFFFVQNSVRKSLIDINSNISFTEAELKLLSETISALQPLKVAVEALCSEDANIYVADVTLNFLLCELSSQNSCLSNQLLDEVIVRIKEQRTIYSDILQYLYNPNCLDSYCKYGVFNTTSKSMISKTIVKLIESTHEICKTNLETESTLIDSHDSFDSVEISTNFSTTTEILKQKLHSTINFMMSSASKSDELTNNLRQDLTTTVRKEMLFFKDEKVRGKYLSKAFHYLKTIKPTSVESERAFSAAALICTKIRSRLRDDSLDKLAFLRAYFMKTN